MDQTAAFDEGLGIAWGWLALLVLLALWMLGAYNRLTGLRSAILGAWAPLESALQARSQALAALLARAAAGPLAGERAALDAVSQALTGLEAALEAVRRKPLAAAGVAELGKADAVLGAVSQRLLGLVELHAELRAEANVAAQLATLNELRPRLQFARQGFNEASQRYNVALEEFPTRLLAPVFRFLPAGSF